MLWRTLRNGTSLLGKECSEKAYSGTGGCLWHVGNLPSDSRPAEGAAS